MLIPFEKPSRDPWYSGKKLLVHVYVLTIVITDFRSFLFLSSTLIILNGGKYWAPVKQTNH